MSFQQVSRCRCSDQSASKQASEQSPRKTEELIWIGLNTKSDLDALNSSGSWSRGVLERQQCFEARKTTMRLKCQIPPRIIKYQSTLDSDGHRVLKHSAGSTISHLGFGAMKSDTSLVHLRYEQSASAWLRHLRDGVRIQSHYYSSEPSGAWYGSSDVFRAKPSPPHPLPATPKRQATRHPRHVCLSHSSIHSSAGQQGGAQANDAEQSKTPKKVLGELCLMKRRRI